MNDENGEPINKRALERQFYGWVIAGYVCGAVLGPVVVLVMIAWNLFGGTP